MREGRGEEGAKSAEGGGCTCFCLPLHLSLLTGAACVCCTAQLVAGPGKTWTFNGGKLLYHTLA